MVELAREAQGIVRRHERLIMTAAVRRARVPRDVFRKEYVGNEISATWINKLVKAKKDFSTPLENQREDIVRSQKKLKALSKITELSITEIKDINRRMSLGEAKARRAKKDMVDGEPAFGNFNREEIHQPRAAIPRPDSRRQYRLDEGGRQIRIPAWI